MLETGSWARLTRGRRRTIADLTQDDVATLLSELPDAWAPYTLVTCQLVQVDGKYEAHTRSIDVSELDELAENGEWQFFIVSESLSPWLSAELPSISAASLATNGCILLQYGRYRQGVKEPASFGHVPVVGNQDGETFRFDEYTQVFDRGVAVARRLVRNRL